MAWGELVAQGQWVSIEGKKMVFLDAKSFAVVMKFGKNLSDWLIFPENSGSMDAWPMLYDPN
jgi:hypothetical protein